MEQEKVLLNVEETAAYLNLGMTKTRELMKENEKIFVVKIGNRNYAHKLLLDKWLLIISLYIRKQISSEFIQ